MSIRSAFWRSSAALLVTALIGISCYVGVPRAAISGWTLENLPEFADVKLAPDGKHAAALQPVRGSGSVVIYTIGNSEARCVFAPSDVKIRRIEWGNSRRLMVQISATRVPPGFERAYEWYRWISLKADCTAPVLLMRDSGEIQVPDPTDLLRFEPTNQGAPNSSPIALMTSEQLEDIVRSADLLRAAVDDGDAVLMALNQVDKSSRPGLTIGPRGSQRPSTHYDLYSANLETGLSQPLATGQEDTKAWLFDRQGVPRVRIDTRADSGRVSAFGRADANGSWRQLYAYEFGERGTRGLSFEGLSPTDPNIAYVLARTGAEQIGAYEYDLRTGALGRPLVQGPSSGVDRFLRDPLSGQIIGVVYFVPVPPIERFDEHGSDKYTVTSQPQPDAPRIEIFDPAWRTLYDQVTAGFEGQTAIVSSISIDRKTLIVFADGGDDRGGAYYFVDLAQGRSWKVGSRYKDQAAGALSSVQSIRFRGRDNLLIPAQLVLPSGRKGQRVPLVVLLEGTSESGSLAFADWRAQVWAHSGYAVLQPQFRGPDGLGAPTTRKLTKPLISDLHAAVGQLVDKGVVDAQRVCFSAAVGSRNSATEDFGTAPGQDSNAQRLSLCQTFAAY